MLLVLSGAAAAQDQPDTPAPPKDPKDELAKTLYRDGDRRYAEGRYEEAIHNFERAFALSKRPLILFAMANTYERMGQYAKAQARLLEFVGRSPSADVDAVRQRIRELGKRIAAQRRRADELAQLRARPTRCKATVCPVYTPSPSPSRAPWVFAGTSAVTLVAGIIFAGVARGARSDAVESCDTSQGDRYCTSNARSALARERRFALFTDISIGAAVVSAGIGGWMLWRQRRRRNHEANRLTVTPGPQGVIIAGGF